MLCVYKNKINNGIVKSGHAQSKARSAIYFFLLLVINVIGSCIEEVPQDAE